MPFVRWIGEYMSPLEDVTAETLHIAYTHSLRVWLTF